jgi:beta-barrel assembly-enhancing protease
VSARCSAAVLLLVGVLAVAGCAVLDQGAQTVAGAAAGAGVISNSQADGIKKTSTAFRKSAEEFTESEEYYIGRSVSAEILTRYKSADLQALNRYVTTLGTALAMSSDRPEIFAGYHFRVLDTDEVNAFATPGGFIFVTRGMLRKVDNEDQLAGVLAHEISHVCLKHGLKSIHSARLTQAFSILAVEAGKAYTQAELGQLTEAFEGALNDIVGTLVVNGYSRGLEADADARAATFMKRSGYNPGALAAFIGKLGQGSPQQKGFAKTHPDSADRIKKLAAAGVTPATPAPNQVETERFQRAMKGV